MVSKALQATYRERLFRHLDGIATAPSAFSLHKKGVTTYILDKKEVTIGDLTSPLMQMRDTSTWHCDY